MSDIIGVTKDSKALAVECKAANGRLRDAQKIFEAAWERCGGMHVLARGIEDLKEAGL